MELNTCYTVQLRAQAPDRKDAEFAKIDGRVMDTCSALCLDALKLCCWIFLKEWEYISAYPETPGKGVPGRRRVCDTLIHTARNTVAKYPEFDERFRNMPAGIRRMLISDALGVVSSHVSNHKNWEDADPASRGSEPVMGYPGRYELTFYGTERDTGKLQEGVIRLKLWNGREWGWYRFRVAPSDAKYIARMSGQRKMLSPTVQKYHGRYRIRFCFTETRVFGKDADPLGSLVMGVDLGINTAASWCVADSAGTVFAKGVIRLADEEDRLRHAMNRKRQYQQAGKKNRCAYRWMDAANRELAVRTAGKIIEKAAEYGVDRIVMEYLDVSGRKHGRLKERLHMWRAKDVQARAELQAHRRGMRISRVCAWGTSKYAYDGSGVTDRRSVYAWRHGEKRYNCSICTFESGKIYNCDLSAAQNIAARYFLREYSKLEGCPELPKTPQRTLSTLWELVKVYDGCRKAA